MGYILRVNLNCKGEGVELPGVHQSCEPRLGIKARPEPNSSSRKGDHIFNDEKKPLLDAGVIQAPPAVA
jgi:hypothetical protein